VSPHHVCVTFVDATYRTPPVRQRIYGHVAHRSKRDDPTDARMMTRFEVSARLDALTTCRAGPKMSRPFGEADATMDGAGRALIDDRSMEILA
jgi:hypothetical protein